MCRAYLYYTWAVKDLNHNYMILRGTENITSTDLLQPPPYASIFNTIALTQKVERHTDWEIDTLLYYYKLMVQKQQRSINWILTVLNTKIP